VDNAQTPSDDRKSPANPRDSIIDDVRRRLSEGELDSLAALLETAHAMLDGDEPPAAKKRHDD
jgi:hypothetical protein